MFEKKAQTCVPIHSLIAKRWSGRAFDATRLIGEQEVLSLIEAARWAPSCYGAQPWRYIVCNKQTHLDAWQKAYDCLVEGNRSWAQNVPLFFIATAASLFDYNNEPNRWCGYDTGAASENLSLQAAAMDMMVHQMGGFDSDKLCKSFDIPEPYIPFAVIAVGYQLADEAIEESLKSREYSERARNSLNENFYAGHWGAEIYTDS